MMCKDTLTGDVGALGREDRGRVEKGTGPRMRKTMMSS